jgi:hypothetical protein
MTLLPRCLGRCRDGSQCSRRVTDGSHPPMCHLHNGTPSASPIIPPPDEVDEMKILRRLAKDPTPQIRLRAVDLLISLRQKEEKGCERCAAELAAARERADAIERMTDAQIAEARALINQAKAIVANAKNQPIYDEKGDSNV